MTLKLGFVMDPIGSITIKKDSTFAMMLAAQARGWPLKYMELNDLFVRDGVAYAYMRDVSVREDQLDWFTLSDGETEPLNVLDAVLMRKDPPFDMEYVYATYILQRAEEAGLVVINKPQSLRDANEKMYTTWFPQCCPPTLVTRRHERLQGFLNEHQDIVVKPLDGMGCASIFRVEAGDPNVNVIFETLTDFGQQFAMAQVYIPEISAGDKRILLINGEAVPYALARIPSDDDNRGNLVMGATGVGQELSATDRAICEQVGPVLRNAGVLFAGIDVIGDFLTEVNVTSPTGIRELNKRFDLNIAGLLFDAIQSET